MLVWNGKSLEQMDTELFGVILFGGLLCVLFPETLLDSIGIKKESKVMVILCRVFGSMAFLLGFYEMFFISIDITLKLAPSLLCEDHIIHREISGWKYEK